MDDSFIIGIGNALLHWTSYLCDVERGHILNEGSIKYGISEYLEVTKLHEHNNRQLIRPLNKVVRYEFEHTHEIYTYRRTDLWVLLSDNHENLNFEFKFVKDDNLPKSEIDRYVNDIFRLYSNTKYKNKTSRQFFILLGSNNNGQISKWVKKSSQRSRIYGVDEVNEDEDCIKRAFGFRYGCPDLSFKAGVLKNKGDKKCHVERFNEEYTLRKEYSDNPLSQDDVIRTRLVYPCDKESFDAMKTVSVFIWEIF